MRGLFVFVPALDAYIVNAHGAERLDEGAGQTGVGYKRNVQVDGGTADLVSVIQLAGRQVARDVHHHVYLLLVQHLQCLRMSFLARPVHAGVLNTVLGEELGGSAGSVQLVALLLQHSGSGQHVYLLARSSGREQDVLFGDAVTYRKH